MKRLLLVSLVMIVISGCDFSSLSGCEDATVLHKVSPNAKYEAIVLERGCGATTDFVTKINLIDREAYFGRSEEVFLIKGSMNVGIEWTTDSRIVVDCENCLESNVFTQKTSWKDVEIIYKPLKEE